MKHISRSFFIDSLRNISEETKLIVDMRKFSRESLPEISKRIASYCFINKIKESEETKLLRKYLIKLDTDGYVNFGPKS